MKAEIGQLKGDTANRFQPRQERHSRRGQP